MDIVRPTSPEELAATLRDHATQGHKIRLGGAFSKDAMGGPAVTGDVRVTTCALRGVVQYEPKDLTISVRAGTPWVELSTLLAANRQMIPLDPPFSSRATVGGVLSANSSGPRRKLYGTPRDVVIGMQFATLEGKLIQSGGMVVKNVAGLDMAKLLIGSFGTLATIATANFKLTPIPEASRTWVFSAPDAAGVLAHRDRLLKSVLQPAAVDILNPAASDRVGLDRWNLLIQAGGVPAVLDRFDRELPGAARLSEADAGKLWSSVREFVPDFLSDFPASAVVRVSSTLTGLTDVLANHGRAPGTVLLSRAASGVTWLCLEDGSAAQTTGDAVIEFAPKSGLAAADAQWKNPGSGFAVMQKVKALFDPTGLLNPGRLYGRI